MKTVTETAVINQPPEVVFAAAADPMNQLKWDPVTTRSMEQVSGSGVAQGARYRADFKGFGTVEFEYSAYDPPRTFEHLARVKAGMMRHRFTLESVPEGTRLTQQGSIEPNLMGRIMGPMLRRGLRKRFQTVGAELQAYLGSGVG